MTTLEILTVTFESLSIPILTGFKSYFHKNKKQHLNQQNFISLSNSLDEERQRSAYTTYKTTVTNNSVLNMYYILLHHEEGNR